VSTKYRLYVTQKGMQTTTVTIITVRITYGTFPGISSAEGYVSATKYRILNIMPFVFYCVNILSPGGITRKMHLPY